jgi:hypothetical protein
MHQGPFSRRRSRYKQQTWSQVPHPVHRNGRICARGGQNHGFVHRTGLFRARGRETWYQVPGQKRRPSPGAQALGVGRDIRRSGISEQPEGAVFAEAKPTAKMLALWEKDETGHRERPAAKDDAETEVRRTLRRQAPGGVRERRSFVVPPAPRAYTRRERFSASLRMTGARSE